MNIVLCYKQKEFSAKGRAGEHSKVHAFNQVGTDRAPVFLPLAVVALSAV